MSRSEMTIVGRGLRIIALMAIVLSYFAAAALPALAQNFTVQFGKQEFDICPGDKFDGSIPVKNTSTDPVSVQIFLGDWVRVPGQGDYALTKVPGKEPRSLIPWMTFGPDSMTLQPGETQDITYEVNVPNDWNLDGSYWDMIIVEGVPTQAPSASPVAAGNTGIGINTKFRLAVHVFATIKDTQVLDAAFAAIKIEAAEGGFKATGSFQNKGNTWIKPKVWLEMHDAAGNVVYTQDHMVQTVLPESDRDFVFQITNPPVQSGDYLVVILADYGVLNYIATQGRVHIFTNPSTEGGASTGEGEGASGGSGAPSG